jgi:hypothetical protein
VSRCVSKTNSAVELRQALPVEGEVSLQDAQPLGDVADASLERTDL